jgi:hypothetical protein
MKGCMPCLEKATNIPMSCGMPDNDCFTTVANTSAIVQQVLLVGELLSRLAEFWRLPSNGDPSSTVTRHS